MSPFPTEEPRTDHRHTLWPAVILLLLMYGLALSSIQAKSPTFDEQGFLTRGTAYLRGEHRHLRVGHPLGLNALNALFVASDPAIGLPTEDPSWQQSSFHRPSELFMWEIGNDVARISLLGRIPSIWLGLLLAALVGRWAWAATGRGAAGLLALALLALDPNILAHTRLATTDLGLAAGVTLAAYTLWRFLRSPGWGTALLAGVAFGLLQNTKFTAGLFVPLFAVVILINLGLLAAGRRRQGATWFAAWRPLIVLTVAYPLAGLFTLWATYGFQVGTLPDNLPILSQLGGLTLPLSHHLEQLLDIGGRLQKSTPAFLMGEYSDSGWWYYFPIAFLLKTPLPTLLLLALSGLLAVPIGLRAWQHQPFLAETGRHRVLDLTALLIPPFGYFAFALTTTINLGYRHLLPLLPFLYVFTAVVLTQATQSGLRRRSLAVLRPLVGFLLLSLLALNLWIYPHYLAYFNLLAGGPDNGWRYLVDSNLDWGQDLQGLGQWMAENQVPHLYLAYFGEGRPDYYSISYTGLDSFPPRLMDPAAQPFYPPAPAPGLYAISATLLQGVHLQDHDRFAWFRQQQPLAKVGYSIFLYEVPAHGQPTPIALGGLQLDQIAPADYALLNSNQVIPSWFDPAQSWLIPGRSDGWLALNPQNAINLSWQPLLSSLYQLERTDETALLYQQTAEYLLPAAPLANLTSPEQPEASLILAQSKYLPVSVQPGDTFTLYTTWVKNGPVLPVTLFIHIEGPEGTLVTQWDGLGAHWSGWRDGDVFLQAHTLTLPSEAPAGSYRLWAGAYHPGSGQRWLLPGGDDRLLLQTFIVTDTESVGE